MSSSTPTPRLNSSSLPSPASTSTKPLPSSTQSQLTAALLTASSIARIESQLAHDLAASGWTANLRTYVTHLLRSGECSTYHECLAKVLAAVRAANGGAGDSSSSSNNKKKKDAAEEEKGDLAVPAGVLRDGVRNVRREVEAVCVLRVDDVDD